MNLDLSNVEQRQLHQAMTDIERTLVAFRQLLDDSVVGRIPARDFDSLRAYLGTIGDAHYRIDQLLYNEAVREPDPDQPRLCGCGQHVVGTWCEVGQFITVDPDVMTAEQVAIHERLWGASRIVNHLMPADPAVPSSVKQADDCPPHGIERPQVAS